MVQGMILQEMSATDLTLKSSERPWETQFLEGLAKTANVTLAAAGAGICRQTAYLWRKESQSFAEQWDDAIQQAVDSLAQVAWERAMHGVEKPVYQQGRLVGSMREYSDALTMFLLKAHRPDRYNVVRHTHEHFGPGRGPIPIAIENAIKQIFDAHPAAQLPAPVIDLVPAQVKDSSCSDPVPEQCERERD